MKGTAWAQCRPWGIIPGFSQPSSLHPGQHSPSLATQLTRGRAVMRRVGLPLGLNGTPRPTMATSSCLQLSCRGSRS